MLVQEVQTPDRSSEHSKLDTLIIAHFDSHGVSFASARLRVLRKIESSTCYAVAKYPETGPQGFADFVPKLLQEKTAKVYEIIDIPVNVKNPAAHIQALKRLAETGRVIMHDHHASDLRYAEELEKAGVELRFYTDNYSMAKGLELLDDEVARELALVGIVADRDAEGAKKAGLVDNREALSKYVDLANRLDVLVRTPQRFGYNSLTDVIEALSRLGVEAIPETEPPFYQYVENVKITQESDHTILADFEEITPMWIPKTAERLLEVRGKDYVVAIVPAVDPRTKQQIGWDVRVIQYWLSEKPEAEKLVKEFAEEAGAGNVVGHGKYVSIRLEGKSKEEALKLAREIFSHIVSTAEPLL